MHNRLLAGRGPTGPAGVGSRIRDRDGVTVRAGLPYSCRVRRVRADIPRNPRVVPRVAAVGRALIEWPRARFAGSVAGHLTARVPGNISSYIGRGSLRHARTRRRITGRPGHDARPGLPRATPRGDGRCRGRIARRGAPDAAAQGVAHELAGRPAQEGRPLGVLLRRGQGALPPGRGDVRPGLPGRAHQQRPGPGGQGAPPAVRAAPRGGPPLPQGGRGRHAAPPPQHRPDHRRGPAG